MLKDIVIHKKRQKTTFQDYSKKLNLQTVFMAKVLFYLFFYFSPPKTDLMKPPLKPSFHTMFVQCTITHRYHD